MKTELMTPMVTEPSLDDHDMWETAKDENGCINPFRQDAFHMGVRIGRNITILCACHDDQECDAFIIVNRRTGEQMRVII